MRRGGARPLRRAVRCSPLWALALLAAVPAQALGQTPPEPQPGASPAEPAEPAEQTESAEPAEVPAQPAGVEPTEAPAPEAPEIEASPPAASAEDAEPPGAGAAGLLPEPCAEGSLEEVVYVLERVDVRGNRRTSDSAVASFVPVPVGGPLDVDDPSIEGLRYRLLGTGWFDRVQTHLERGTRPGKVVLVIEVVERNTLVIQKLAAGVGWSVRNVRDASKTAGRKPQPYLGAGLADLNFLGTGKELGLEFLLSPDQQGVALEYADPLLQVPHWSLFGRTLFTNGQEYFGGDDVFAAVNCDPAMLDEDDLEDCEAQPPAAVVDYWRGGLHLGGRRDVGVFTHLSLGYRGDFVRVPPGRIPAAASAERGRGDSPLIREPIDFSIEPGNSFASMLTLGLTFDRRDSTATPTRGTLVSFAGDLASGLIGSDYEFVRLQTSFHRWRPLPWGHVLRGGAYAGTVFGDAPFFYQFFVTDLTDLAPSRILGLNLDHRPAPNLFGLMQSGRAFNSSAGTAISQMRIEQLAARLDVEYVWPFTRKGRGFLKSGDFFVLLGMYLLADPDDLRTAVPGYDGVARAPLDLTVDVGIRLDTDVGVFRFGFAKIGWLPVTAGGGE